MMRPLSSILLISFFGIQTFADVVFIDLNHVNAEIKVVREELAKRKPPEKLILLPLDRETYANKAKRADALDEKIEKQSALYDQQCQDSSTASCQSMQSEYLKLKNQKKSTEMVYNTEALKKDLSSITGANVSSVMVSGHHVKADKDNPSQFYGDFGNIPVNGFMDAFKDFPGRTNVSSVYLLGCRSAIPQDLGSVWKTGFPNANYIVGYENTGYLQDNIAGHSFIRKTMSSEKSILSSKTTQEAIKKFQAISPKNATYGTAACITLKENAEPIFISSTKGSADLASKLGCSNTSEKLKKVIDYMKCVELDSNNSNCSLKDISKINDFSKKECDFQIPDQLNEAVKFRSQQKVLENLMNPGAKVNFSTIFARAPEALKRELRLTESPASLSDAKTKIAAIKKSVDAEFEFDKLQELDIEKMNELAQKKVFFDNAYLAVSNLDIAQYDELLSSVENPPTDRGGTLRAQAFQMKAEKNSSLSYESRIQFLNEKIVAAPGGSGRSALKKERDYLEEVLKTTAIK